MALLADPTDLESYLGRSVPIDQAEFTLSAVCGDIVSYCGWSITAETTTWTLDAVGGRVLELPTLHLRSVTAVALLALYEAPPSATAVTDYSWSESGYLHRLAGWPCGPRTVTATVEHGYVEVPKELVAVACAAASRLREGAGAGPRSSRSIGDYSESFTSANELTGASGADQLGLAPHEVRILDRYRIHNRA